MKQTTSPDDDLTRWETQIRKGGLGLAVLATLWPGKLYGLEMLRRLDETAGLSVPEGTIYPLLSRLKTEGLVSSEWVDSAAGHPAEILCTDRTGPSAGSRGCRKPGAGSPPARAPPGAAGRRPA